VENFVDNVSTGRNRDRFRVKKKILLILAKHPTPGFCKTRLTPPLSPQEGARLQDAMVRDISFMTTHLRDTGTILFHTPAEQGDYFRGVFPEATLLPQVGEDLGKRLEQAFRYAFETGGEQVIAIGTDSPSLPSGLIEEGFRLLDRPEGTMVIGPAEDGGYWCIGMNRLLPPLFHDIPWGSERVFPLTVERAARLRIPVHLLPVRPDIDTMDDLLRYHPEGEFGHETYRCLQSLKRVS